jgi:hypothetical protein
MDPPPVTEKLAGSLFLETKSPQRSQFVKFFEMKKGRKRRFSSESDNEKRLERETFPLPGAD